jgi:hypothetical protein
MKKYLNVIVTRKNGSIFTNPLKLSEAHFISQLAQENLKLEVHIVEIHKADYNSIFGIR